MISTLSRVDRLALALILLFFVAGCQADPQSASSLSEIARPQAAAGALNAAFLTVDGVYNSELMAPYDILHHTIFRDSVHHVVPFVVSPDGQPVTTFEGLVVSAHYSFDDVPPIDILVIPSAEGSMSIDLQDERMIDWIAEKAAEARYVMTLCDGAFPLAATGHLDGREVTTFPADRDALQEMFPALTVHHDRNFVVDGKYITSVGGALSYEPALYILESEYSVANAVKTAEGLVLDWDLSTVPHLIAARNGADN